MPSTTPSAICLSIVVLSASGLCAADILQVRRIEPANSAEQRAAHLLKDAAVVSELATFVSATFVLPERLTLELGASDGPLYDPSRKLIAMPYGFVEYVQRLFRESGEAFDQDELDTVALDVLEHTLYHELGHALVEMLQLPVVGKEEDAVDSLATILLIESFEEGPDMVASVADLFYLEEQAGGEGVSFWDDHSLDIQRFYTALCLVYGSDPENNADLVEDLEIDDERLAQCPDVYQRALESWLKLLNPHLRDTAAFAG